jgi:valyl-tRNA synthetase
MGSAMLDKAYRPEEVEQRIYKDWEESGAFTADVSSQADPYTIMIPPPNVTGSLHMGHALNFYNPRHSHPLSPHERA